LKNVLVLAVAKDQDSLAGALRHYELKSIVCGIDGDQGNGAIVVLSRRHGALPFPEIEGCDPALSNYAEVTQLGAFVSRRQARHQ
jgi:hypothetical protein